MNNENPLKELLTPPDDGTDSAETRSLFVRLRNYFLAGVLVTAPIAITIVIVLWFLNLIDSTVRRLLPGNSLYSPEHAVYAIPGLGIAIAIVFFILVGWFARNYLGQLLIRISEYILAKMPIVRTLYAALKQIFETVMASKSQAFREVVMVEYPRKDVWALGFLTGKTEGEVQRLTDTEVVNVFLPTTPNPTSGFLLFLPKKDVIFLNMSVEEGIKMIVSAGIITPPDRSTIKAATPPITKKEAAPAKPAKAASKKPAKKS
ncbi:MAG: DUF502 domain-containing protein [Pseudobdellovibrionaceae bacterium]